ncbi:MAG TPA: hypothetical protein VNQ90_07015 [Chthoniobacteraceae bacterium]|nr:hypothetical protein [Chthoniobacteraceae bacterium]
MNRRLLFSSLAAALLAPFLPVATASAAPLVRVGKTSSAPALSGRGDDPAWKRSIAISDFVIPDSGRPLAERTEVRLLWDDGHLYVQARLEESTLLTASQQQSEIKANATERDGKVISDDSFLLILRPEGGKTALEWTVNTRGVFSDAKADAADLWTSRDLAWNAGAGIATSIGDGFWIVEMAIPWSELGQKGPPSPDKPWQAVFGRHAATRGESGSWSRSNRGIHSPQEWGQLVFGEAVPGVAAQLPDTFEPGANRMNLELQPGDGSVMLTTRVETGKARPLRTRQNLSPKESSPVAHSFELQEGSGAAQFSWALIDAANLQPLYQSPQISVEVLASSVQLRLSTTDAWRLLLNDAAVASGTGADRETVTLRLRTGSNVIALETQSGTARLELLSPDLGDAPLRWKMNAATAPGALKAATDDGEWETAPVAEDGAVGRSGSPLVLRHTLLLQQTRIFPAPLPALYIAGNMVQQVSFTAFGLPGRRLHDWKTWFELPEEVEAIGATGYYGSREGKPRFTLRKEGGTLLVEASAPITARPSGVSPILNLFEVAFRHRADDLRRGERALSPMRHYSRANDATVSELVQQTPVVLLPPINGKAPEKLTWQIWTSYFAAMDNAEIRAAATESARAAGFNDLVGARRADLASTPGLHSTMLVNFKSHSLNLGPWLAEHPEARLIRADGQPDPGLMCATLLLGDHWKEVVDPLFQAWWADRKVHTVNYDFEAPPMRGPHSCFCERCLKAFRAAAKLPESTPLDGGIIQREHLAAWTDFMARRVAQVFRLLKESTHALPGKVTFEGYSGYQTPDNAARYGVDWRYVGEFKAADRIGVGYGRDVTAINDTIRAADGIPVILGELVTPYMKETLDFSRPTRQLTKANLLRRSIDSTGGILAYHTQNMDGRSWRAAGEVSRLVAAYEPLFGTLRAGTLPGQSPDEVALLRGAEQALLCVMNTGPKEKTYRLTLPKELGPATEFYSGKVLKPGETLEITLPPGEAAVYATP